MNSPQRLHWSQFHISCWGSSPDPQTDPAFFSQPWTGVFPAPLLASRNVLIFLNVQLLIQDKIPLFYDPVSHLILTNGLGGFVPSCYILMAWLFTVDQRPICISEPPFFRSWCGAAASWFPRLPFGLPILELYGHTPGVGACHDQGGLQSERSGFTSGSCAQ